MVELNQPTNPTDVDISDGDIIKDVALDRNAKLAEIQEKFKKYEWTEPFNLARNYSRPLARRMQEFSRDVLGADVRTVTEVPEELRPALLDPNIRVSQLGIDMAHGSRSVLREPHELIELDLGDGMKRSLLVHEVEETIERGRVHVEYVYGNMFETDPNIPTPQLAAGYRMPLDLRDIVVLMTRPVRSEKP